ncbi:hypothetical protein EON83_13445 [bacterium]|nr:MAG: hypothetical protein EON83_13445 [bacterium]
MRHLYSRALTGTAVVVVLGLFLKLILTPDPVGDFFLQAGRLEASGATGRALMVYDLIVARHPNSSYAPRALVRVGDLLSTQGRQEGDKEKLKQSVDAYVKLARSYPKDPFAVTALQNAGSIAAQDLGDRSLARGIYAQIIRNNGQDSEIGAEAVIKLARLSIADGDGKRAQGLLQEVMRRWNNNPTLAAEAQYFLGVCYETVFRKRDYATRAYNEVIARFPKSQWAGDARERLGLLVFGDRGGPPTRRVLLNIQSLPDEIDTDGESDNAMWNALRLALAARGLSGDTTLLQGYSLSPFYAGLNPNNAGEIISLNTDAWSNVVAAAGFRFSVKGGGQEQEALRDLQDSLDAAQLPLVYWQNEGQGHWSLAIGYDSERGEIMLQDRGAQFDTLAAKTWATKWKVPSTFKKTYTLISLIAPGNTPNPKLTPTPIPSPMPGNTPAPIVNGPPTFVWGLAPIKEEVPIGKTADRAATLLLRNGTPNRLLNANALDFLANAFAAAAREASTASAPEVLPTNTPSPIPAPEENTENSIYDPTPTSAPVDATPAPTPREQIARAEKLWPFWNAPVKSWIAKRRNAAQWCRLAALKTNNSRFTRAAELFIQSAEALEIASRTTKTLSAATLADNPTALDSLAASCRKARDAEREAANILG